MLQFAEWTPDNPDLSAGSTEVLNVYPRTDLSYGPIKNIVEFSSAMGSRCQGAFFARKPDDGINYGFSGDATHLYLLSGSNLNNVSKASNYLLGNDERWEFVQYGNIIIAAGWGNPLQMYNVAMGGLFSDLSVMAPQARHIAVIRDFLVTGNTLDGYDGFVPNRIRWSAINDPTNFPVPATQAAYDVQSDYQDLISGGWVQGIVGAVGGADGAIVCETSVYRMQYEGGAAIFRFDEVERKRGSNIPGSILNNGTVMVYHAEDGWYLFDGAASQPIGSRKIDRWFNSKANPTYYSSMSGAVDPLNKLFIWLFSSTGLVPDNMLIWNWELNKWSHAEINLEFILPARTMGYTLEGLDGISIILDNLPFSLDSRVWTGGAVELGAFSPNHKLGFLQGNPLDATITTGEISAPQRIFVNGIRPLVDGGSPTVSIGWRDTPSGPVIYNSTTSIGADGICPQRQAARYMRAKVSIPSSNWSHAMGVEPYYRAEGKR